MSYLIEILIPVRHDTTTALSQVRDELTKAFGGLTMHANAPAEGLWEKDDDICRDRIVVAEVMVENLDAQWWATYRRRLEALLQQEEIVIRATEIRRL
jgi:hypothetical protein